jgi:hypothetical protein
MDRQRRRGLAITAFGMCLLSVGVAVGPLLPHTGTLAGLPVDFWRGFPLGMAIAVSLAGLLVTRGVIGRRRC